MMPLKASFEIIILQLPCKTSFKSFKQTLLCSAGRHKQTKLQVDIDEVDIVYSE